MAISLHTIKPAKGSRKTGKRVGRGLSKGGSYSGRGVKGQRARAGGRSGLQKKGIRHIMLALKKNRGFKSPYEKSMVVNLGTIASAFPDGAKVVRWDREGIPPATGSDSHLTHTHVSWYRDSEARDKTSVFRRYFEEEDEVITAIKGEEWKPTVTGTQSNGVFRESPDRAAPIVERVGVDVVIRSIAEIAAGGLSWRLTERMGKTLYMFRPDWVPLVPGGDPAVDKLLDDYIAGRDPAPKLLSRWRLSRPA